MVETKDGKIICGSKEEFIYPYHKIVIEFLDKLNSIPSYDIGTEELVVSQNSVIEMYKKHFNIVP